MQQGAESYRSCEFQQVGPTRVRLSQVQFDLRVISRAVVDHVGIHTSWKGVGANGSVWDRADSRQDTTQDTDVAVAPIRLVCRDTGILINQYARHVLSISSTHVVGHVQSSPENSSPAILGVQGNTFFLLEGIPTSTNFPSRIPI
jgi:hypothetical protein